MGDCPSIKECSHCGSSSHTAKRCTFGAQPDQRFLPCKSEEPRLPCFWRRFLVPLRRADAAAFDPADPRQGRADVGFRCTSAALCRSQGLRRNCQACLCFEASGHTLEISGALVRDLRPDEGCLGGRIRAGLDSLLKEGCGPPDPEQDPEGWSASSLRGFEAHARSREKALKAAVKGLCNGGSGEDDGAAGAAAARPSRVAVLLLTEGGMPLAKACTQLRDGEPLAGVVTVVGDDRGLPEEECAALAAVAERVGGEVLRVSLGGTTLLASHAIVIVQHYLDERLHRCEVGRARDYGFGKKASVAVAEREPKRQKLG